MVFIFSNSCFEIFLKIKWFSKKFNKSVSTPHQLLHYYYFLLLIFLFIWMQNNTRNIIMKQGSSLLTSPPQTIHSFLLYIIPLGIQGTFKGIHQAKEDPDVHILHARHKRENNHQVASVKLLAHVFHHWKWGVRECKLHWLIWHIGAINFNHFTRLSFSSW